MTAHATNIMTARPRPHVQLRVEPYAKDKSWRVALVVDGQLLSLMLFDVAETLAGLLGERAQMAAQGIDELPESRAIALTRGRVMARPGRVLLFKDANFPIELYPEEAQILAVQLRTYANVAKAQHWADIDKHITGGAKVKAIWNMPICTSYQQAERLGDREWRKSKKGPKR